MKHDSNQYLIADPVEIWKTELKDSGYEHTCRSVADFSRLNRLSRTWEKIISVTKLESGAECFEVGCGGAIQLVQLALKGYRCSGVDVSNNVLQRAKKFIKEVEIFAKRRLSVRLEECDFMNTDMLKMEARYDLVFNAGVIEHYLNDKDRISFLRKKILLAKEGGWVVSIVPSGVHPYRQEQKHIGWGGYNVPEIDYSPELLKEEMLRVGAKSVVVLPNNIFGYLQVRPKWWCNRGLYLLSQVFLPFIPKSMQCKHAYSFVVLAQK